MSEIRAVIVDDESLGLINLEKMLERYTPEINIVAKAMSVMEAVYEIDNSNPDLVFLDISLPDGDGFSILENVKTRDFDVIFVTAYDQFALKAIEFSALHYLLKPIDSKGLVEAVDRYKSQNKTISKEDKYDVLQKNLDELGNKIVLPMRNGFQMINIQDLLYVEADGNYSIFHMKDGESHIVSKPISLYENLFDGFNFFRIHTSYLVHLAYIEKYISGRGGIVIIQNGVKLSVSARRKQEFVETLKQYTNVN